MYELIKTKGVTVRRTVSLIIEVHKIEVGVNFSNILRVIFNHTYPKSSLDTNYLTEFLIFWDLCLKTAYENVYEIDPRYK